jgi:hypothetical protein
MSFQELDRLVTATDIGKVIGVGTDRLRQIAYEDDTFPRPIGRIGQARVWRWCDMEAWAKRAGRPIAPPDLRRWTTPRSSYARTGRRHTSG